jgi:hypothetical protein
MRDVQGFVTSKQLDIKLVSCQVAMNFQVLCPIGAQCFFPNRVWHYGPSFGQTQPSCEVIMGLYRKLYWMIDL